MAECLPSVCGGLDPQYQKEAKNKAKTKQKSHTAKNTWVVFVSLFLLREGNLCLGTGKMTQPVKALASRPDALTWWIRRTDS